MTVASVSKQIASIRKSAEPMHAAKTEVVGSLSIGDAIRQGDLYLVRIGLAVQGPIAKSRQLAPGTTQGSRHMAVGECDVIDGSQPSTQREIQTAIGKVNGNRIPVELLGPVVVVHGNTTIEHPEHGHKIINEPCVLAVVYQRAYAEEVRRVKD